MTGFGKAVCELGNKKITVEIKSLNSKQFDLSTRISSLYREKDLEIRNEVMQQVERGKIDLAVYSEQLEVKDSLKINPTMIGLYYDQLKQISENIGIEPPKDWLSTLLQLPDVMRQDSVELEDEEWESVKKVLNEALLAFRQYRQTEGEKLEILFSEKIENIRQLLSEIEPYESERVEKIRSKLTENLAKYEGQFDNNRLEQELIFYIEKLDVNEEKQRLSHHLDYFLETMKENKSQGKKLGFITQEIGREINTLGSKSNHAQMQKIVVQMKDELEQIKEQVLNAL